MADQRIIGIIAGNGVYPETFARAARSKCPDVKLVAAAFEGETSADFLELVDASAWFRVGQLGKMIKFFKAQKASEAIMVGQIDRAASKNTGQQHSSFSIAHGWYPSRQKRRERVRALPHLVLTL